MYESNHFQGGCSKTRGAAYPPLASWAVRLRALDSLCIPWLLWSCEALTWNADDLRHIDFLYLLGVTRVLRLSRRCEEGWLAHRIRALREARRVVLAVVKSLPPQRILARTLRMAHWAKSSDVMEPLMRALRWRDAQWEAGWPHSLWRRKPTRKIRGWDARWDARLAEWFGEDWATVFINLRTKEAKDRYIERHAPKPSGRTTYEDAIAS